MGGDRRYECIIQTFKQIILTSGWHQMNNSVCDATQYVMCSERLSSQQRGEERESERRREKQREREGERESKSTQVLQI